MEQLEQRCSRSSPLEPASRAQARQTESDEYTRYELLEPGSAKFRIVYEVTATTAGATYFFNPIRKGSVASNESVSDRATGKPLEFDVVGAAVARTGGVRSQDTTQTYIRVKLTRPVPADGGEARVLIDKTYEDASSYFLRGDTIVFSRPLGIKRNAVVLPKGYELVSCNFPSQVLQETDGRIGITFWNNTPCRGAAHDARGARRAESVGRHRRRASRRSWATARTRIARSSTSFSSPRRTRSICTTTTRNRGPELALTSMR